MPFLKKLLKPQACELKLGAFYFLGYRNTKEKSTRFPLKGRPIYFFKQLLKIHIDISSVSYEINFYEALFFYYHVDNTIFANGNGAEAGKLINEFLSVKRMIYKSFNAMFHAGVYRWREFFNRISCFRQIYGGLRDASHIL